MPEQTDAQGKNGQSILSRVPGFRSGVLWKKILASVAYFFILMTFIGMLLPGPGVEDLVKDAQESMAEKNYGAAAYEFEAALKKWDDTKQYPFTKADVEKMLSEANAKFEKQFAQEKAAKLANEALEAYKKGDMDTATARLREAAGTANDSPRLKEVRTEMASGLQAKADEHMNAAAKALQEWDVAKAENEIAAAMILLPDDDRTTVLDPQLDNARAVVAEIGPKPENSAWNAAVTPVCDFLRANLKDPDSVKYAEWSPVSLASYGGQKCWAVRCKYRAKNSFGGYVLSNQIFYIRNNQVVGYQDF